MTMPPLTIRLSRAERHALIASRLTQARHRQAHGITRAGRVTMPGHGEPVYHIPVSVVRQYPNGKALVNGLLERNARYRGDPRVVKGG